jgi:acetyl-CoA synthetase
MSGSSSQISSVMHEGRVFPPTAEFVSKASIASPEQYQALWDRAAADPEAFWGELARQELHWFKPFEQVLRWNEPFAEWFVGGQTNASYNCLDAHLAAGHGDRVAIVFEGEPGDQRTLTYGDLHREVCRFANVLKARGIRQGDVVSIYMPLVPELVIAMLACARVGATHSVIFAGFSAEAIADRNQDARAKMQITADGGWRRGKELMLKDTVDQALAKSPTVESCIVLRRLGNPVNMQAGRDYWWHELVAEASDDCPAEPVDSENTLFILYTSGSTGKPKGIRHTTAGYSLYVKKTFQWVFDHKEEDLYWCTADCGWVTGHSYVVYGPLAAGAKVMLYEGAPNFPAEDRFWDIIERHRVNILYTAPTAIRAFIKWGDHHVEKHDLSSLRLLGTVGEGINPEAWMWYHRKIGNERCPIAVARRDSDQARQLHEADAGHHPGYRGRAGAVGGDQPGWLAGDQQALARDAARHLGRRCPFQGPVLEQGAESVSGGRQRAARLRRILLDHGAHRRRAQRVGASLEHD